jgi:hypothetical protein
MAFKPEGVEKLKYTLELPAVLKDDKTGLTVSLRDDPELSLGLGLCIRSNPDQDVSALTPEKIWDAARSQAVSVILNAWLEGIRIRRERQLAAIASALAPAASITSE